MKNTKNYLSTYILSEKNMKQQRKEMQKYNLFFI